MRKLASIQKISGIRPIPGADKIEVADVLGWSVVVKKGDFNVGDLVVYFEVDAWLDASIPAYASFEDRFTNWGDKRGMRLKTIKLRKQISQGLILSPKDFPELMGTTLEVSTSPFKASVGPGVFYNEGDDVTDILKVEKWEPLEVQKSEGGNGQTQASKTRSFPWFLHKTDQERVQNYIHLLAGVPDDESFEVSTKLDGSSMTVYCVGNKSNMFEEIFEEWNARQKRGKNAIARLWHTVKDFLGLTKKPEYLFGVCSRNIELGLEDDNHFSQFVRQNGVIEKIQGFVQAEDALAFQGELIAPSIQNNFEKVEHPQWYIFDVFNISTRQYLRPVTARMATEFAGLKYVPVIGRRMTLAEFRNPQDPDSRATVDAILAFAEGPGMNPGVKREGVVFKSNTRDFSFKAISNSYLLEKG